MGNHRVRFGLQFATAPISSGTRSGYGWEIGPRCRSSEIARQCGAAVGKERPSGQPGGLFLWAYLRATWFETRGVAALLTMRSKTSSPREHKLIAGGAAPAASRRMKPRT